MHLYVLVHWRVAEASASIAYQVPQSVPIFSCLSARRWIHNGFFPGRQSVHRAPPSFLSWSDADFPCNVAPYVCALHITVTHIRHHVHTYIQPIYIYIYMVWSTSIHGMGSLYLSRASIQCTLGCLVLRSSIYEMTTQLCPAKLMCCTIHFWRVLYLCLWGGSPLWFGLGEGIHFLSLCSARLATCQKKSRWMDICIYIYRDVDQWGSLPNK